MSTIEQCSCESSACYRADFFESYSELVISGNTTRREEKVSDHNTHDQVLVCIACAVVPKHTLYMMHYSCFSFNIDCCVYLYRQ